MILLLSCILSLTACSSQPYSPDGTCNFTWDNGIISANGKALANFSEISGSTAKWTNGTSDFDVWIEESDDLGFLSVNSQGITQENMDKYKDAYYYTEYLGTMLTFIWTKIGNYRYIAQGNISNDNIEVVKKMLNDDLSKVLLTWGNTKVEMNGVLTFGNDYDQIIIRPSACLVKGVAKVSVGTKAECTTPYSHVQGKNTYELMTYSNGKYDFYTYEGLVIQLASGVALSDYITFK